MNTQGKTGDHSFFPVICDSGCHNLGQWLSIKILRTEGFHDFKVGSQWLAGLLCFQEGECSFSG